MAKYDVDFNYTEKGENEWQFGCCEVECLDEDRIEDTLLSVYDDVEVLDYNVAKD